MEFWIVLTITHLGPPRTLSIPHLRHLKHLFYLHVTSLQVLGSPDQAAWDLDVDNNTLRLHITEQLASVLPVGSWQLIESVQVGTPWAEGRTLFKLYIIDPTRREA